MPSPETSKPGYYAIIPAHVRYSKIPEGAKLLFGEITSLCNERGYCWATNQYFADHYDKDAGTISRWVKALRDKDFIFVEANEKEGNQRRIYLHDPASEIGKAHAAVRIPPLRKNADTPSPQNYGEGIRKNAEHNITVNNQESASPISEEIEEGASHEKIIFEIKEPGLPKHELWTDFIALLVIQGNEEAAAKKMLGRLITPYGPERMDRCYRVNCELIHKQVDPYGYYIEILKRDKKLGNDEGAITTALREARYSHAQKYAALDNSPAFDPAAYVGRYPALKKYIDEIKSGKRTEDPADVKARLKQNKFNDSVMEQARFYGRI